MAGFLVGALVGGGIGWLIGSEKVIEIKNNPRQLPPPRRRPGQLGGGVGWLIGKGRVEVRKKNPRPSDFTKGELVYWDSMSGLVPAKFVGLGPPKPMTGVQSAVLKVTAARGPYKKGETVETSLNSVVKRSWVHRRGGQARIIEPARSSNQIRRRRRARIHTPPRSSPFPHLPRDPFAGGR